MYNNMIEKPKTLTEQLLELPLGEENYISVYQYKPHTVRQMVCKLNKQGYDFSVTEKGCADGCKVTRNK